MGLGERSLRADPVRNVFTFAPVGCQNSDSVLANFCCGTWAIPKIVNRLFFFLGNTQILSLKIKFMNFYAINDG